MYEDMVWVFVLYCECGVERCGVVWCGVVLCVAVCCCVFCCVVLCVCCVVCLVKPARLRVYWQHGWVSSKKTNVELSLAPEDHQVTGHFFLSTRRHDDNNTNNDVWMTTTHRLNEMSVTVDVKSWFSSSGT